MKKEPEKEEFLFETPKFKIKKTGESIDFETLKKIVAIYQERLKKLSEISELTDFFFKEKLEYKKELLRWKDQTDKEVFSALDRLEKILSIIEIADWNQENLEKVLTQAAEKFARETGKAGNLFKVPLEVKTDRGYLLWPFRVALTGKEASAGPFEIAEILGKEKTLKRIKEAKERLKN